MKVKISDNKELVSEIDKKLKENEQKYGKRYCPCILPQFYNTDDNVCMCQEFIDSKELGECHCGKYIKYEL